jgi:hypothetical protein
VFPVRTPEVDLVGGTPVADYSFGFAWHTLDRQYEIPVTVLRAGALASADLSRSTTLVLPELSTAGMAAELGEEGLPAYVPGPFFRGDLNRAYWLTAGLPDGPLPFQVSSARIYLAPDGPPSSGRRVVGTFDAHEPHISGHAWPETLERIPGSVFAYEERVGEGRVVALSEDVNFRSYWRGGQRLFLNAVVLGPSAP